jgi:hypothetical protein
MIFTVHTIDGRTMKKNEHIFISLQLQKDIESNDLQLSVQFDKDAPNFSSDDTCLSWRPTTDEMEFIFEAFELFTNDTYQRKIKEQPSEEPVEKNPIQPTHRSSEIRIGLPPSESVLEVTQHGESIPSEKKGTEDKLFVQADEKTIDEVIKRKKTGADEEYVIESGEKTLIDRMLKQKKKKD